MATRWDDVKAASLGTGCKLSTRLQAWRNVIFAYGYEMTTGAATNRRTFHSTAGSGVFPDGATVDAEGYVWSAQFGAIDRVVELPIQWVASMTFGEDDHEVLYVTSIGGEEQGKRDPLPQAGGLFAVRGLGIRGLPEPRFAG